MPLKAGPESGGAVERRAQAAPEVPDSGTSGAQEAEYQAPAPEATQASQVPKRAEAPMPQEVAYQVPVPEVPDGPLPAQAPAAHGKEPA